MYQKLHVSAVRANLRALRLLHIRIYPSNGKWATDELGLFNLFCFLVANLGLFMQVMVFSLWKIFAFFFSIYEIMQGKVWNYDALLRRQKYLQVI